MKFETKILIVAIILILSAGPAEYFFINQPKQIELLNETANPTSYALSGTFVGKIIGVQPYIRYVGVSNINSRAVAESILDSIPDIANYNVTVSLNPYGNGYLYGIDVPIENLSQMQKIGFRLALRFSIFFVTQASPLPITQAKIAVPKSFMFSASNGNYSLTARSNQSLNALVLYSGEADDTIKLSCSNIVTNLNYSITKLPAQCEDTAIQATTLLNRQNILEYGLSLTDFSLIQDYNKTLALEVLGIKDVQFKGSYHFAGLDSVSINGLEEQTNSSIFKIPKDNNPLEGNFTIITPYASDNQINSVKAVFAANNFTITEQNKDVYLVLPNNVTINGKNYDIFITMMNGISTTEGTLAMADNGSSYPFITSFKVLYDEIVYVQTKKA